MKSLDLFGLEVYLESKSFVKKAKCEKKEGKVITKVSLGFFNYFFFGESYRKQLQDELENKIRIENHKIVIDVTK